MSNDKLENFFIILSFLTIYIVWGSTYLANEFAIDYIPPWLMAGVRFFAAGSILMVISYFYDWEKPTLVHWKNSLILGFLFMSFGIGITVWAQKYVDSGFTSLLISTSPLVVLLMAFFIQKRKPTKKAMVGVVLGIIGMYLLVNQQQIVTDTMALIGSGVILLSVMAWSYGMLVIPSYDLPESKIQRSAMQMFCGGILLLPVSFLVEDYGTFSWTEIPWQSLLAWGYLIIFGSIATFTAFNYLLTKVAAEKVATNTYVNPVIALFLGWWLRDEVLTNQMLIAAAIMLTGVYFINSSK